MRATHSYFNYEIFFVTEELLTFVSEYGRMTVEKKGVIIPLCLKHYTPPAETGAFVCYSWWKNPKTVTVDIFSLCIDIGCSVNHSGEFTGILWQTNNGHHKSYVPRREVMLDFSFGERAFVIHKGEKIRIVISSSGFPLYVWHTNQKGLLSEQTTARIADNTVVCDKSSLKIRVE